MHLGNQVLIKKIDLCDRLLIVFQKNADNLAERMNLLNEMRDTFPIETSEAIRAMQQQMLDWTFDDVNQFKEVKTIYEQILYSRRN